MVLPVCEAVYMNSVHFLCAVCCIRLCYASIPVKHARPDLFLAGSFLLGPKTDKRIYTIVYIQH